MIPARAAAKETRRTVDLLDIFFPLFPYIIDLAKIREIGEICCCSLFRPQGFSLLQG